MAYDKALTALADPTRRAVFERLRRAPASVSKLAADLPVSRPAVSQHLRALKLLDESCLTVTGEYRGPGPQAAQRRVLPQASPGRVHDLELPQNQRLDRVILARQADRGEFLVHG